PLVLAAGSATLVFGGLRALRQQDLKLLLAFGTVSQLGLLIVLFGAGTPATWTAGWMLLVAHAAFKAALFMVVGILDRGTGTRDLRRLPALGPSWRGVEVVSLAAVASMAGVPLGAGFVAKELAYDGLGHAGFTGTGAVLGFSPVAGRPGRGGTGPRDRPRRRQRHRRCVAPGFSRCRPGAPGRLARHRDPGRALRRRPPRRWAPR